MLYLLNFSLLSLHLLIELRKLAGGEVRLVWCFRIVCASTVHPSVVHVPAKTFQAIAWWPAS